MRAGFTLGARFAVLAAHKDFFGTPEGTLPILSDLEDHKDKVIRR